MNPLRRLLPPAALALAAAATLAPMHAARAETAQSVTQYGITWTFDKPYPVGKFVTGDYWVVGPVTVVSVTPGPGPAPSSEPASSGKSIYGATNLTDDRRVRNGSMIFTGPPPGEEGDGFSKQGYDSRPPNFAPEMSVRFPCALPVNRSLISTISSEKYDAAGKLETPMVIADALSVNGHPMMISRTGGVALDTAAILTCLSSAPPADAFRPPYAGNDKPIYEAKDLHRDLLPKLKPVAATPDWAAYERVFERPWLDHTDSWLNQSTMPGQNQPNYGREYTRLTSMASLMLLLDVPPDRKEKLLIHYVQLGIDLHGLTRLGKNYFSDGGHWQGRKWPILFASILLNKPELAEFPEQKPGASLTGKIKLTASPAGVPPVRTVFQEDLDTFYGKGGEGQTVLWQCVFHTQPRPPYEQKTRAEYTKDDHWLDGYRFNNSGSWIGAALSAHYLKAKALWNHDAFFDYVDRWMSKDEKWDVPKWLPAGTLHTADPFMEQMWNAYRADAPAQPGGKDSVKWVWDADLHGGHFAPNPKGSE